MRILIVGAGATGGYFGGRLAAAGRDVTFLVRAGRAAQLRAGGLQIVGPAGDLTLQPQVITAAELQTPYDAIVLSVKAFALDAAIADFAPAVGEHTMIVPLLNGMRHIDVLIARFGERPVLGGLCFVATTLDPNGRIMQLSALHELTYGERGGGRSERVAALDGLMQDAGFTARASERIIPEMWDKWLALASLGGMNCLLRGTVGEIVAAPGGTEFATAIIAECAAVNAAAGFPMAEDAYRRTCEGFTRAGSPMASSMYRDLRAGNDVEADQLLGDLLARARTFGVATPLLAAAYANLKIYQAARGRLPLR